MKNQFFYKTTRPSPVAGEPDIELEESFNINFVLRSGHIEGNYVVLLNDIHERSEEVPEMDFRTKMIKGTKRQRSTFQSQIILTGDDINRFKEATSVL